MISKAQIEEMYKNKEFLVSIGGNDAELVEVAYESIDHVNHSGYEILEARYAEFLRYTDSTFTAADGLSGETRGFGSEKFCTLVAGLRNLKTEIDNTIIPLATNLEVKSLDIDGLQTSAENIGYFLDNLNLRWRDKRF